MESLYGKYKDKGLKILAFPANNFMGQEPGTNSEIKSFCRDQRKATFDLFSKVSVKGDDQCPLYQYLTNHPDKEIAGAVKWNFQKYLVDRRGVVVAKFGPRTSPEDKAVLAAITEALDQQRETPD